MDKFLNPEPVHDRRHVKRLSQHDEAPAFVVETHVEDEVLSEVTVKQDHATFAHSGHPLRHRGKPGYVRPLKAPSLRSVEAQQGDGEYRGQAAGSPRNRPVGEQGGGEIHEGRQPVDDVAGVFRCERSQRHIARENPGQHQQHIFSASPQPERQQSKEAESEHEPADLSREDGPVEERAMDQRTCPFKKGSRGHPQVHKVCRDHPPVHAERKKVKGSHQEQHDRESLHGAPTDQQTPLPQNCCRKWAKQSQVDALLLGQ